MITNAKPDKVPMTPPNWTRWWRRYPTLEAWIAAHPGEPCGRLVSPPLPKSAVRYFLLADKDGTSTVICCVNRPHRTAEEYEKPPIWRAVELTPGEYRNAMARRHRVVAPEPLPEPEAEPVYPCPTCGAEVFMVCDEGLSPHNGGEDVRPLVCSRHPFEHIITEAKLAQPLYVKPSRVPTAKQTKGWARFWRKYKSAADWVAAHPRTMVGRMVEPKLNGRYRPQYTSYVITARRAGLEPIPYDVFAARLAARQGGG